MKKVFLIFLLSFILNVVWENLHSFLYAGYMGGKITEFILLRASVVDAAVITLLSLPFIFVPNLREKSWLIMVTGVLIAIGIELYALNTGRWAYNEYMPMVPLLGIGLTPAIQLGLLGHLSYRLVMGNLELRNAF
ncbi:MAG TPA: hypothetical protein VI937_00900 [Negativicutes bacterium]|nr:hypothetical protein [Negativicutes bacterium]